MNANYVPQKLFAGEGLHIVSGNLLPAGSDWYIKVPTANSWEGQTEVGFCNFPGLGPAKRRGGREIRHAGRVGDVLQGLGKREREDRKSTRLNSSHS